MIFPNLKCYNFVSQNVSSLPNESITFCSTNSQFINVCKDEQTKDIYVEISDLNNIKLIQNKFKVPFQNVDKIIYCEEGNYLALVGIDFNQFAKVCIYFNWWLEQKDEIKSKSILNNYDNLSTKDSNQLLDKNKINLDCVEIKTNYFKEETKNVKINCCERSGNLLIGYVNKIEIYKYFKKYYLNNQSFLNNFVHLLDVKIKFDAEFFRLAEQLLLCSSIDHCQIINLDFQADIHLNSNIEFDQKQFNKTNNQINLLTNDQQIESINNDKLEEQTIYLPLFRNEKLNISPTGHLDEIIGPIKDKLCCKIDIEFNNCLNVNSNNINILFCLNLITSSLTSIDNQFEIVEEDGYAQVKAKIKNEKACKTFLLPVYDRLKENPLELINELTKNPLHSIYNSKLIYFNLFVFKNDHLVYYLIDKNFKIEKFKLNQLDIKNFNLKSVIIDESFIYLLTKDSLYTYYFGLFNILNYVYQLKFTTILNQNLNELLLKTIRPLLLNKNSFLGSHQLINTPVQLIVLSQDDQSFTKYSLKKPSHKQSLFDAKENLILIERELNTKEKINFYFYLINLCKSIKLNQSLEYLYIDYCLILLKLLINQFPQTNSSRKLIIEFIFKYTNLKLIDLIEKDDKFLFKQYDLNGQFKKTILEDILDQLIAEDKLNQKIYYDSLFYYDNNELISKKVLENLNDLNLLKLTNYLNLDYIIYLIFSHQFNNSNWTVIKEELIDKILNDDKSLLAKCKILFDCERLDELNQLINKTNEMNIYCELLNYKDFILPSIDFLSCLVKFNLSKSIRFLHKLISSNISSEYIFSIFKDNKLLFILLDNYLCITRSEQIPEKLLINLVVNYWKILNDELNYDLLCDELGLKYQWTTYQTPFINLLRPYHNERENDDCLNDNSKCLCDLCSPSFNKLQFILNIYSTNNEIKSLLNHLIKNSQIKWSWRIKVQISNFQDAISILYDKLPETILFYILEQKMDNDKWILLIDFLDKKQRIHGLETKLNHKILYHLANILSPLEFINLIPDDWKPIMNYYFRICLEKYQGKCIKNQIMNYLDKDYATK